MSENRETREEKKDMNKQEVTNEMLLEHLKELEQTQSLLLNSFGTIFTLLLEHKEQLKLDEVEQKLLMVGIDAIDLGLDSLGEKTGMNEVEKKMKNVNVRVITSLDELFNEILK